MKYIVTFEYMDGESFPMEVHPDDIERLMDAIGKNEVFYNPDRGIGVWVPIDKVRFFHVEHVDENGKRVSQNMSDVLSGHEPDREEETVHVN